MNQKLTLLTFLFVLSSIASAIAQNPTISIQGILKDANGKAVDDGDYDVTFKLYNVATDGTALWEETATTTTTGGVYSHDLGSETALIPANFSGALYLGVNVNNFELRPRMKLGYAPFAMAVNNLTGNGQSAGFNGSGDFEVSRNLRVEGQGTNDGYLIFGSSAIISNADNGARKQFTLDASKFTIAGTGGDIEITGNTIAAKTDAGGNGQLRVDGSNLRVEGSESGYLLFNSSRINSNSDAGTRKPFTLVSSTFDIDGTGGDIEITGNTIAAKTDGGSDAPLTLSGSEILIDGDLELSELGIGTSSPIAPLHVASVATDLTQYNVRRFAFNDNIQHLNYDVNYQVGILSDHAIVTKQEIVGAQTVTQSDVRIKEIKGTSDSEADLEILNQINITDYGFIDKVHKGNRREKKVIAQEVKKVLPQAVSMIKDVIPNVYQMSSAYTFDNGLLTVTTDKAHDFAAGDEVKIIADDKTYDRVAVAEVVDAHTFTIEAEEQPAEGVFVYGKYVDDFHVVDYDAIAMLNVSATQELHRLVKELQAENAALRSNNSTLEGRLAKIEAMLMPAEVKPVGSADRK